ncbi:hypothetical protein L195_g047383, partial [Trifolium pratense]
MILLSGCLYVMMADVIATVATAAAAIYFQEWLLMWGQYIFHNEMVEKIKAMGRFIAKSKDIQPFSDLDSLP